MVKPKSDEVGILLTMAAMGLCALTILGYYACVYWPYVKALFK